MATFCLVLVVLAGAPQACAEPLASSEEFAADAGSSVLDEVVVTARRRSEAAQDVPVAVSVLTASRIEDAGVFKWDEEGRAAQRRFVESL